MTFAPIPTNPAGMPPPGNAITPSPPEVGTTEPAPLPMSIGNTTPATAAVLMPTVPAAAAPEPIKTQPAAAPAASAIPESLQKLTMTEAPQLRTDDGSHQGDGFDLGVNEINQKFKEREIAQKAKQMGVPYINLLETPINPDIFSYIKKDVSFAAKIVPFYNNGRRLRVAVTEPDNPATKAVVAELLLKYDVDVSLCSPESLAHCQKNYEKRFYAEFKPVVAFFDPNHEINLEQELAEAKKLPEKMEGKKSDEALNLLHEVVLSLRISDIHIQPQEQSVAIRARIDGVLKEICRVEFKMNNLLVQQIKHDASLKYNITNVPQDGKYTFTASDRTVDVRVSTLPTNFGESIVLRFLDAKKGIVPLEKLGYPKRILDSFQSAITSTMGMILVTGPTGSGKTTTLYSAINQVNTPDKKIVTLEDPIEFRLQGVLQSGVDHRVGFDFAKGLRSILRQDPDIVLVGEIRDKETAETAIQAALTGHIVFSTLHTNSAADAIPRLMNMGVAAYVVAPALRMITAQRLVRKICNNCKIEREMTEFERQELAEVVETMQTLGHAIEMPKLVKDAKGCEKCGGIRFRGETAITEVLIVDDAIQRLIFTDFSSQNISFVARNKGMLTMWEEGLSRVIEGITTVEEIKRRITKTPALKNLTKIEH